MSRVDVGGMIFHVEDFNTKFNNRESLPSGCAALCYTLVEVDAHCNIDNRLPSEKIPYKESPQNFTAPMEELTSWLNAFLNRLGLHTLRPAVTPS